VTERSILHGDPETEPAELIANAVLAVPGVAGLHGGMFGEVATYLPGRRVLGVALGDDSCAIHISVRYPAHVIETAERVRAALVPMLDVPVDVTVEDVLTERTAP
jgi:NADPH-dependent curcumin reductase CurA